MSDLTTPENFISYVLERGYNAYPIMNMIETNDVRSLVVVGYELSGPRGNRKVVMKTRDGQLPLFDARLWCDGVDYSSQRIAEKRARKVAKRLSR